MNIPSDSGNLSALNNTLREHRMMISVLKAKRKVLSFSLPVPISPSIKRFKFKRSLIPVGCFLEGMEVLGTPKGQWGLCAAVGQFPPVVVRPPRFLLTTFYQIHSPHKMQ